MKTKENTHSSYLFNSEMELAFILFFLALLLSAGVSVNEGMSMDLYRAI
jgi:hypothetical protein